MKITDSMTDKELRLKGKFYRTFLKYKTPERMLFMQKFMGIARIYFSKKLPFKNEYIKTPDNKSLRLCVYSRKDKQPCAVGLLWIHGGGFAIGVPEQDYDFINNFLTAENVVCVSPDYRLTGEAPYPAALDDCYNALLWMKDNAGKLGIRSDKIFVGGDSAGGGLAAALCLYARDKNEVNIAFQMPFYPMLDDRETESSKDNDAPVWNSVANKNAWKLWLGKSYGTENISEYAAPARAENLEGLPPAYSFVGTIEPFHDETVEYFRRLNDAGVNAKLDIYDGAWHSFDALCKKSSISQKARKKYIEEFKYAVKNYTAEQK